MNVEKTCMVNEEKGVIIMNAAQYDRAVSVTRHIKANAAAMQESLYEVCKGLKEVRDDKLYKELGYQNFENYCEAELNITYRQAKKYVAIANGFENEGSRLPSIGTEKLYLLTKLDEADRQELIGSGAAEQDSVRELKEKIKQLEQRAGIAEEQLGTAKNQLDSVTEERDLKEKARVMIFNKWHEANEEKKQLQKEVDALKAKPAETVTVENTSRIEEMEQKLAEANRKLAERPMIQEALHANPTSEKFDAYFKMFSDTLLHIAAMLMNPDMMDFEREQYLFKVEETYKKHVSALKGSAAE